MAKIENVVLHTLLQLAEKLKQDGLVAQRGMAEAESDYNKFMNDRDSVAEDLQKVQDSITLLQKQSPPMKKRVKKDDQ